MDIKEHKEYHRIVDGSHQKGWNDQRDEQAAEWFVECNEGKGINN